MPLNVTPSELVAYGTFSGNLIGSFAGYQVYPASVDTTDPVSGVNIFNGNTSQLSMDGSGRVRVVLSGATPQIVGTQPSVLADSTGVTGRAVGPAAATVIATITPAAGTYDVQVWAHYDAGAPAAAEINNMQFRKAAGVVSVLSVLAIVSVYSPVKVFRMVLTGAQAIDVQSIGVATAGVGYNAEIIVTRVA
jgi:hypothetical protein